MLTDEQLALRKSGLGGSDIAAVLGVSPWKSALELWVEKTSDEDDDRYTGAMEWGQRLEAPVLQKFIDDHPDWTIDVPDETFRKDDEPWLLATPDATYSNEETSLGVIEVKTASGQPWEQVPYHYQLQLLHYLYVFNVNQGYFAVLFNGREYREYGPITLDRQEYEDHIYPALRNFWDAVEGEYPPAEYDPTTLKEVMLLHPIEDDLPPIEERTLPDEIQLKIQMVRDSSQIIKKNKELVDKLKAQIADAMEGHSRIVDSEGKAVCTLSMVQPKPTLDTRKLMKDKPELLDEYGTQRKAYPTLRIY